MRTLLIVDDIRSNREILKNMLGGDYQILEAEHGREALAVMAEEYQKISAVLLDLGMPVMDGYEVLSHMQSSEKLSQLPVIVTTGQTDAGSEERALKLGAKDYISKPYKSAIIKQRIWNTIKLRETAATVNALQRDRLTGLYSRDAFFEEVQKLVSVREAGYYTMAAFDVDRFKVINDQYGTEKGDAVLRHIADVFQQGFESIGGICCRISADNFAALYPTAFQNTEHIAQVRKRASTVDGLAQSIAFSIGRYVVTDRAIAPSAMYDRAMLAADSVKGRYGSRIGLYCESMREHLLHEQEIVTEMESALHERQFEVWYQPQYNHSTGALIGAEALVRWRHPQKGLISPDSFIPVFEQNGFIYSLDKYVWESVCHYLKSERDAGRSPLPVSVNISRHDVFRPDFFAAVTGLVRRYGLPVSLLRLEITESAFVEDTKHIVAMVRQLVDFGFTLEIDDFGSGYSSLNTLKSVPAQVVKLDMRFLEDDDGSQRGGNIIESIVRMTKWLGMSVLAEGVESRAQADFLKSIGCSYVQGYLYARPMPEAEYRELCGRAGREEKLLALETVENLDNDSFWNPKSMDTLIFNSYVGAACVYEYYNGKIEMLRATDKYAQDIGGTGMTVEEALRLDWMKHLDAENKARVFANLESSAATKKEVTDEYVFLDLPGCPHETYLRSTMRVIASAGERQLVYCMNENITAQRLSERRERQVREQMQAIMDNVDVGIIAAVLENGGARYLFANDRYYELLGYTEEQFKSEITSPYQTIAPEDAARIFRETERINRAGGSTTLVYNAVARDKQKRLFRAVITIGAFSGVDGPVQMSIVRDITKEAEAEQREITAARQVQEMLPIALSTMMDSQTGYSFVKDRELRYICCSREAAAMANLADVSEIRGKTDYDLFDTAVADAFVSDDRRVLESGEAVVDQICRLPSADSVGQYASTSKFPLKDPNGSIVGIYGIGHDVTESRAMKSQYELLTNSIPGGIATYEMTDGSIRMTYFNDGFCKLFGLTREEYTKISAGNVFAGIFDEDLPKLKKELEDFIRGDTQADCVYRVRLRDGGYKWINLKAASSEREDGKVIFNAVLFDVTQRQNMLEHLRISEEENRLAMRHTSNIVCRYDVAARTLHLPESAQREYQLPERAENIPSSQIERGLISPETADAYAAFYESIHSGGETGAVTYQRRAARGWRWLEGQYSAIPDADGKPASAVISIADVTEQLEKEFAYKRWQQSFKSRPPESYSVFRCNVKKTTTFDSREGSLLTINFAPGPFCFDEHTAEYAAKCVCEEDKERFLAFLNVDALLSSYYQGKCISTLEYRELLPDGKRRWLRLTVDLVEHTSFSEVEAYLLFENIDEAKVEELATIERAQTDPLTGVLNRSTFSARVNELIRLSEPNKQHALMLLDVDGFKQVNDAFGHRAGDQVLVDIAASLHASLRHDDIVGRLGGDEYLLLLTDITGDSVAASKAGQICAVIRRAFSAEVEISGSIGIAVTPRDGTDFDALYKKADAALYHVKGSGKNNFAFYSEDMSDQHLALEKEDAPVGKAAQKEKKRRMLIVDDSIMDNALLANIFEDRFIIEKAKGGNDALIRLRHYGTAISVVLLDLMMPGMDGFAVLKKMRESAELQSVPVIVVSGDESRETGLRAIREGAVDFVNKPVDAEILSIRVQSAISKAENERLRAKNSFLEFQSGEVAKYRAALESSGIVVVENDWTAGTFGYDPSICEHIAGVYDDRGFWRILLSDLVAETRTVQKMQQLVQSVAADKRQRTARVDVRLKAPDGNYHLFRMSVSKKISDLGSAGKIYMAFIDLGAGKTEEQ